MKPTNRRVRRARHSGAAATQLPALPPSTPGSASSTKREASPVTSNRPDDRGPEREHGRATSETPEPSGQMAGTPEDHEAACASLRSALANHQGTESERWQRVLQRGRKIGWPEASVDEAWADITGPWGARFDDATGRGGQGAAFRARIPVVRRYHTELLFDLLMVHGIREPSMLIRVVVHRMRATACMLSDRARATELHNLAGLFERHPEEAVDYAAEWAMHFDKRMECAG